MDFSFLSSISILLAFAILVLLVCYRFKIPEIIGLLLTGVVAGPYVLGLFSNSGEIEYFAEIGVVLLLFTIGMEFSFKNLIELKREFLIGGSLQVLFTFIVAFIVSTVIGLPLGTSILAGFLLSLSSTAIVLRVFQERNELESPHGRIILGILIFQDIAAVPMMLAIPFLTGNAGNVAASIPLLLVEVAGILALVIIGTVWVVPRVLHRVASTRSNELFLLSVVVICLGMAWLTQSIGLSLALGAFLAGLIISESQFSHQALGGILPFRYVFTSFFFVSIGMLLDVRFLIAHPIIILGAVAGIVAIKAIMAGCSTALLGYPIRTITMVGLALAQVGEFSFILSKIGLDGGLLSNSQYQLFLSASILTMALSPFLIGASPRVSDLLRKLPLPEKLLAAPEPAKPEKFSLRDHLVIIGYGLNGRNVSRAAKSAQVPYVIVEMNPDTVTKEKLKGEPIFYGDATTVTVLEHASVGEARVIVVAISDSIATRRIITAVRTFNPHVHIIVRTRYTKEMKALYSLGANEVIPEEFETSVEIFARVLKKYLVPKQSIDALTAELRSENYEVLRCPAKGLSLNDLKASLADVEISTAQVTDKMFVCHRSIKDIQFHRKYEVTILLIQRGQEMLYNPGADLHLLPGDTLYMFGTPEKLTKVMGLFTDAKQERNTVQTSTSITTG